MPSPVGELVLVGAADVLCGLYFGPRDQATTGPWGDDRSCEWDPHTLPHVRRQLDEYFCGQRTGFEVDLALAGTDFQRRVWRELCNIPYGTTISYGQLAESIGQPSASRAVGSANGRNRIAIIIPCHRVVARGGRLGGYSAGLDRKATLLRLENASVSLS
ncbi:MAG: methylated-DNA--[protein]-cysteine S-methyltransferase [Actinomycetes bacterium]